MEAPGRRAARAAPRQRVQSASVGDMRAARSAGSSPAAAPMTTAAPSPPAQATAVYAHSKGWATVIPPVAWAGGLGAAVVIGAAAGMPPALRAARMSPTEALWTF